MAFTPCKAEQPLQVPKEEDGKNEINIGKLFRKRPKKKKCLLTLDLRVFRSQVTGKHFADTEFMSLTV